MRSSDIDQIWKYLEGDITKEEAAFVDSRLQNDDIFIKSYMEQVEIYRSLSKTETIEFRKKLQQLERELKKGRSSDRMTLLNYSWLLAAAIGIIFISTGYILQRLLADNPATTPIVNSCQNQESVQLDSSDTLVYPVFVEVPEESVAISNDHNRQLPLPGDQQMLAEGFESLPLLEEMIDIQYRSVLIKVSSPENGSIFTRNEPILFRYDGTIPDSIFLTIMSNKAQIILERPIPSHEYKLKHNLHGGLYYFQLITKDEILHTGKFFIKY